MTSSLTRVVLLVRPNELHRAVNFYSLVGLQPQRVTDTWAELVTVVTDSSTNRGALRSASDASGGEKVESVTRLPTATAQSESPEVAMPTTSATTRIHLQAASLSNEAAVSTGYSPILVFQVTGGTLNSTVAKCVQAGAHLDGPLQYPAHGKVAVMRSPHGHMIGLYEPSCSGE
jgi:hypothetical protein